LVAGGLFGISLQHHPILTHTITQVARDDQLLNMARDYFHFATKFYEVITTSATHIYHSALELSPLSSAVRRLYYHQRPTPSPRVVAGAQDSWDQDVAHYNRGCEYKSCAWSPCSQFIATKTKDAVEIWDSLTLERLSTLTNSGDGLVDVLAYSPDGRSLACLSGTALIIWDIQTGGVAKRTECSSTHNSSLLWSLDGSTIGVMKMRDRRTDNPRCTLHTYHVASGTTRPRGSLCLRGESHFWAHNETFRIMTSAWDDEALTVDVFEAGSTLTKVESFSVQSRGSIKSFSPTTHRVSISTGDQLVILDVRNSGRLLDETGKFRSHCFSSDGSLFAASPADAMRVWQYTPDCYTPWRKFPCRDYMFINPPHQFSPACSSILRLFRGILQVWRLPDHPTAPPDDHRQLAVISHDGTYVATANKGQQAIVITKPLSHTPPHFIDAHTNVEALALTGSVLLAVCSETIVAWRLTEEGAVDGVIGGRRADQSDSVWTVSRPLEFAPKLTFEDEGQVGIIKCGPFIPQVYHTGTGEVLRGFQMPSNFARAYSFECLCRGMHHLRCYRFDLPGYYCEGNWTISRTTMEEGWVKDPEGKHRLWMPLEWRVYSQVGWFYDITTLEFGFPGKKRERVIVML